MDKKIITVDFDGVVIEKVAGMDWKVQKKSATPKSGWQWEIYRFVDFYWAEIISKFRKPVAGSRAGLERLKKQGYKIYLLTSRYAYQRETTLNWMKKWGYFELYDEFYFNDRFIGAIDSKLEKIDAIRPEVHIDDNVATVEEIAKANPEVKVFLIRDEEYTNKLPNVTHFREWKNVG